MGTIRGRLTAWYATALTLTLTGFAVALYIARRSSSYVELDRRIESEAELTAGILGGVHRAGGVVMQRDPAGRPALVQELIATFEAVPDYLIITTAQGRVLFANTDARALTFEQFEQLRRLMLPVGGRRTEGTVSVGPQGPRIRYVVRTLDEAGSEVGAVLAGRAARC